MSLGSYFTLHIHISFALWSKQKITKTNKLWYSLPVIKLDTLEKHYYKCGIKQSNVKSSNTVKIIISFSNEKELNKTLRIRLFFFIRMVSYFYATCSG